LKSFPESEDNAENYRKILKTVLNYIGISAPVEDEIVNKPVFVDPGYNDDPRSKLNTMNQSGAKGGKKS